MSVCAKCKKELGGHFYIMFGVQENEKGYWFICLPCHDEIRLVHPIKKRRKRKR